MTIDQQDKMPEYADGQPNATSTAVSDNLVIPLISEEVHIDRQWVETGRTRLIKEINKRSVPVSVELLREETDIERTPLIPFRVKVIIFDHELTLPFLPKA